MWIDPAAPPRSQRDQASLRSCVFGRRQSEARRSRRRRHQLGGARRDRTDDLMLAKHALYQLSYGPKQGVSEGLDDAKSDGGPGKTRTSDLTLIKRAL